ncbi:hypothetical protein AGABI1DRAFT_81107 [Agaricus bisporus var. burnettii JB137-S8]|uniref:Uncharacterized protein n=1 Tax=Agaricus bisporus var. burnettii (strain JB137-S8 / ATCC MYA-4627 / FGSC 10392) TaxID=597362 RepID=K5WDQ3_AGABU|nr:hypothetical protein AGABI2DRAFT_209983 [Agaricus bisporus var. bisporus H97]EKM73381.1 hypothetical protein AGABI1DRAFT_81107 [Agaricus bisporus var. burnettii JB137-S8]EKV44287.1 hypothetical protein AGABI2DRAFT_209983 [Agaricus bisporus var. bisporus H97]
MLLGIPRSARCVQRFDDSLNSAIHITYRISLRSSSMREPRDPLLKVADHFLQYLKKTTKGAQVDENEVQTGVHILRRASYNPSRKHNSIMILPQVHLRKPCYDFYFL